MYRQLQQVQDFHELGGHPIGNSNEPQLLSVERAGSRANWMMEEVAEFEDAVMKNDLPGAYDALADLLYFTYGTVVEMGGQSIMSRLFERVHEANMTKFDRTEEEALITSAKYAEKGIQTYYGRREVNGKIYWPVYFAEGDKKGKIAKSHNWKEPDFTGLFPDDVDPS